MVSSGFASMASSTSTFPFLFPTTGPGYAPYSYPVPVSDFFPAPAYGSPSLPSTTNYHHPFPFTMAALPYVPPTPATPESIAPAETPATALLHRPDRVPSSPLPTDLSSPTPQLLDTIQAAPNLERCKNLPLAFSTWSDPTLLSDFALQLELARRSLLDISRQLDEYQAQSKRSFASLQSGISRLVDMVPSSKSSTTTARTQSVGFNPSSASITLAESTTPVLSNIGAAEISPASSSSASFGGSFDVPKPASALTVPTAPAAPQVLDEMLECYSLHNLNRHSLFLADGTERSYYVLPENFDLERAVRKPVFDVYDDESDGRSSESVHLFTDTPEHQIYEEENQESFETLKCCSKTTFSARKPIVGTVGIFSLENDARACNFSVLKASNSVSTRSNQFSIEHCKRESRLLWDPGASTFLMTPQNDDSSNDPIGNEHVGKLVSSAGDFYFLGTTDLWSQSEHRSVVIRVFEDVMLNKPPAKPPDIYGIAASSPPVILLEVQKAENLSVHIRFNFLSCNSRQFSAIQTIQGNRFSPEATPSWQRGALSLGTWAISALWRNTTLEGDKIFGAQHILDSSMKKGIIFSYGHILSWNPRYAFLWEFSMDKVSSKTAVPTLMDLRHFWAQFWSQSHSWYNTLAVFLQVHYCGLAIVLDCPHSETVLQFACYSCMFSLTEAIFSAICMSTATSVCAIVVLCSGKISQEGRDAAVLYKVLKIQLQTSNTSHIWDPGIESLLCPCKGLNITELIQIKGWTSMTYTGIFLSEYPYILIFLHEQWELLHQQGAQKNYNANKLLSSQNYLQICEMDIIFITFLPP